MEAGVVSVRLHHGGPPGAKPKAEVVAQFWQRLKNGRMNIEVSYDLDVVSSWCYWTEPVWAELKRRHAR
jgi:hypothetical protein